MPNPSNPPPPDNPRPAAPARPSLADSLKDLRKATRDLTASSDRLVPGAKAGDPPSQADTAEPDGDAPQAVVQHGDDPDAQVYYERLEQSGRLADVADDTELSTLPPGVTHIRRPDGKIERIGFSAR